MPKVCPKPRRTPCTGAWPYEQDECCYKRLPKPKPGSSSRKEATSVKAKKPTTNAASKAARKIAQGAMKKATRDPTVADLRAEAKTKKIKGYSKMAKTQLMQALSKGGEGPSGSSPETKNVNLVKEIQNMMKWAFVEALDIEEYLPPDTKVSLSPTALEFLVTKFRVNMVNLLTKASTLAEVQENAQRLGQGEFLKAKHENELAEYFSDAVIDSRYLVYKFAIKDGLTQAHRSKMSSGTSKSYPDGVSPALVEGYKTKFPNADEPMVVLAIYFLFVFYVNVAIEIAKLYGFDQRGIAPSKKMFELKFKKRDFMELLANDPEFLPLLG